jgi:hypothetical protein
VVFFLVAQAERIGFFKERSVEVEAVWGHQIRVEYHGPQAAG